MTAPHNPNLTEADRRLAEAHRGFVREMDQTLGKAYGYGGGAVVAVLTSLVFLGWFFSLLTSPLLWVPGLTFALFVLFIARQRIYAFRDRLRQRVESYCEVNSISTELLLDFYIEDDVYSFFPAIFEGSPTDSAPAPLPEH